ncbi:MAG: glycosyltransferase [Planctomycetes bacterium]|nr:glycosyltransferase [Planctomycetota bacterium]
MEYAVIIPMREMEGNPHIGSLLTSLAEQSFPPVEVHVVVGDRRQGRAINIGVSKTEARYVGTLDDDTVIDDPELFGKLLRHLESHVDTGLAGAACEIPQSASAFQKKAMKEIPRRYFPVQRGDVESDMVQHPCLLMHRELFLRIGGEDEDLIRGLDPVLRKKVRDCGLKVVIVKETWVYHLVPDGLWGLLRMYYRNGRGSGYAQRHYPGRVLELSDGFDQGLFVERRNLPFRILRRIGGGCAALARLQWLKFLVDGAYVAGVTREMLLPSKQVVSGEVVDVESQRLEGFPFKVSIHRVRLD